MDITEAQQVLADADCLYSDAQVQQVLDHMAADITAKIEYDNPLILSVMTGGIILAVGSKFCCRIFGPIH